MADIEIETGFQLFARLSSRPNIENIYPNLFKKGPSPYEVVEITGNSSTGKTFLITEIIANCLLPETINDFTIGGKNAGAIIINTDHHFQILHLVNIIKNKLNKFCYLSNEQISNITKNCLEHLIVLNCFESQELFITFQNLDKILSSNHKISLVVLDSICAFYWADRVTGGIKKIDSYQKTILKLLQNITKHYKIVIMFTKTTNITSKEVFEECYKQPTLEKSNYRIYLEKIINDTYSFVANITDPDNNTTHTYYNINQQIQWQN